MANEKHDSDLESRESAEDLLRIAAFVADRFQVMQAPVDWNPDASGGRDVDCFVEGLDHQWPLRLPTGWRLVQALQYRFSRWQWWVEGPTGTSVLDTTEDPRGIETGISTQALMTGEGIEPLPAARAVYLTEKRLFKGMLDSARWQEIASLAAQDPSFYRHTLEEALGRGTGHLIADTGLAGIPPSPGLVAAYRRARRMRWIVAPHKAMAFLILEGRRILRRTLLPTGLSVLVVGPDGSGKSTFAQGLLARGATLFRRQRQVHWTPDVLPRPSRLLGRSTGDPSHPQARAAHSVLVSYLTLGLYWVDNILGGWLVLRHVRRRTGLVLVERGWWDIAVDPIRYRMRVSPRAVALLGAMLPRPDVIFVLDAPAELLHSRKPELAEREIDRQLSLWRELAPKISTTVRIDVSRPTGTSLDHARAWIVRNLEGRTAGRTGAGWLALPFGADTRFLLPRGPARVSTAGLRIYHPMTSRGLLAWEAARFLAGIGGFRLSPRGQAPPYEVRQLLSKHIPRGGTVAIQRANHKDRWVALVLDGSGCARKLVKLSTADTEDEALQREAVNIERFASRLAPPLVAPRLLDVSRNMLVFEPVEWLPRRRPWSLPTDVAHAAGCLAISNGDEEEAFAHGDFAPWNLLKTEDGWVLIDWEDGGQYPLMFDLFHYVVQAHVLLGHPTQNEIEEALNQQGHLGQAMSSFANGAGAHSGLLRPSFTQYLRVSKKKLDPMLAEHRVGIEARERLLAASM